MATDEQENTITTWSRTVPDSKKIQLYRGSDISKGSWKTLASSILSDGDLIPADLRSKLDVNPDVYLCMTKDVSAGEIESKTENVWDAITASTKGLSDMFNGTKIAKMLSVAKVGVQAASNIGNSSTGYKWDPWMTATQAYDGVKEPVNFSYTFDFALGQYGLWNAQQEVFLPILNLITTAMPTYVGATRTAGPFPSTVSLLAKAFSSVTGALKDKFEGIKEDFKNKTQPTKPTPRAHGPQAVDFGPSETDTEEKGFSLADIESIGGMIEQIVMDAYEGHTYTIEFGNYIAFYDLLITKADYTFSSEVDDKGYPISGTVTLTFQGMAPIAATYGNSNVAAARFGV